MGIGGREGPRDRVAIGRSPPGATIEGRSCPAIHDTRNRVPMPKMSKAMRAVRAMGIIAGIEKRFGRRNILALGGRQYTPGELAAVFQSQIDAVDQVDAAHAAVVNAVAREREIARTVRNLTRLLRFWIGAEFGSDAEAWADFGLTAPKKPGPKTVEAKLAGAERARATRKMRHTMGKRQRKKAERGGS